MKKLYKAVTFKGMEDVLASELKEIGAEVVKTTPKTIFFKGDKELLYRANIYLRTALRIIMPLKKDRILKAEDIYFTAKNIPWENYFDNKKTFKVTTVGNSSLFKNLNYASLKVKDAIADRFKERRGKRPNVNSKNADIGVHVFIREKTVEISLDSTGESLHKRGYRLQGHKAPLNEVLAAAMILVSSWNGERSFYDFMCGSGTLLIEAFMKAENIPPNLNRKNFSFMNWKDYCKSTYENIVKEAYKGIREKKLSLFGNDIDEKHIDLVKKQLLKIEKTYGINSIMSSFTLTVKDYKSIKGKDGVIIINPPYGERLKQNDDLFYYELGKHLKDNFRGCDFWILTPDIKGLKKIKMKPEIKKIFYNGGIEVRFQLYKIRK